MSATTPLRLNASARVKSLTRPDGHGLPQTDAAQTVPAIRTPERPNRLRAVRRWLLSVLVLSAIWGVLTGWRADSLIFGIPAVLLGAAIPFLFPKPPHWRLSLRGALVFGLWFAVQSVRGAVDVALRAFAPDMGLRPCFRACPLTLPPGAPRVMFVNTITLLPGTLSAEIMGDTLIVHMLDARADLDLSLADLEARIRALFALPQNPEHST